IIPPFREDGMPLLKDRREVGANGAGVDDGFTLVDQDVMLVGEIVSEDNLRLRGRIEGNVSTSGSVVIEPQGSVRGDITAQNLIVEGSIEGKVVVARKFELRPTGRMRGDIRASIVAIAEDAFLQGKVLATEKISTNVQKRRPHPR
ncbi:MAG TPA: polymer-forming cytoskeletal protein, partial [Candidatus Polarisedimenticolia bacterium]|nr:polymer-forming cytoskeletal protein [Candidatus Polarisedimenticolia bacterium]